MCDCPPTLLGNNRGDCCAATCTSRNCTLAGDTTEAFGQTLAKKGTSFPNCKDPSLNDMTIELNTSVGDLSDGVFDFFIVKVECQDGKELPLVVYLDPKNSQPARNSSHTIKVADSTSFCTLSFSGIQQWATLSISFAVIDDFSNNNKVVMKQGEVTSNSKFQLPPMYNKCLKEKLEEELKLTLPFTELYDGRYRDKAATWLHINGWSGTTDCKVQDSARLLERYALVAMSYAEVNSSSWISPSLDHCFWNDRVTCNDGKINALFYGKSCSLLRLC